MQSSVPAASFPRVELSVPICERCAQYILVQGAKDGLECDGSFDPAYPRKCLRCSKSGKPCESMTQEALVQDTNKLLEMRKRHDRWTQEVEDGVTTHAEALARLGPTFERAQAGLVRKMRAWQHYGSKQGPAITPRRKARARAHAALLPTAGASGDEAHFETNRILLGIHDYLGRLADHFAPLPPDTTDNADEDLSDYQVEASPTPSARQPSSDDSDSNNDNDNGNGDGNNRNDGQESEDLQREVADLRRTRNTPIRSGVLTSRPSRASKRGSRPAPAALSQERIEDSDELLREGSEEPEDEEMEDDFGGFAD